MLVARAVDCSITDEPSDETTKPCTSYSSHNRKSVNSLPEAAVIISIVTTTKPMLNDVSVIANF